MKKFSLVILTAFMASASFAQLGSKIGFKGGLNIASTSHEVGDVSPKYGLHAGLLAHFHLSPQIGLQPEIVYSSQGMKQEYGGVTYPWSLDYINVPIMLQYMFDNGFRIEAGPQFGLMVSGKMKGGGSTIDVKDELNKGDVGLGIGVNYLSSSGFGIGGRYNYSVTNINENETPEFMNRVGQISVFYMFDAAHKAKSR